MQETVNIVCPHCQSVNRVLRPKLADVPTCGKCKQRLFTQHPIELTSATFQQHITRSGIPVVVDFWASWCGPCKMMAPHFENAAQTLEPQARLAKVNTEQEQALAAQMRIQGIPTLVIFKDGAEVARQAGAMVGPQLISWIQSQL